MVLDKKAVKQVADITPLGKVIIRGVAVENLGIVPGEIRYQAVTKEESDGAIE